MRRRFALLSILVWLLTSSVSGTAGAAERVAWLWDGPAMPAWSDAHAAVVVQHVLLRGSDILVRPRPQAPRLGQKTRVTPVVHVELSVMQTPVLADRQRQVIVDAVRRAAGHSSSGWVQLDLEARPSQRAFYVSTLRELRAVLPAQTKLSVTALAWWCRSPDWLDELPVDEVVPMFFRMGHDAAVFRRLLAEEPAQLHRQCRQGAAGFSMQEPVDAAISERYEKTYWFDDRRWR